MNSQKFFRGQRVRIGDLTHGPYCYNCGQGKEAIVVGSYSDLYGKQDGEPGYSLFIPSENDTVSWYPESSLELVSDDRRAGEELIQKHKAV